MSDDDLDALIDAAWPLPDAPLPSIEPVIDDGAWPLHAEPLPGRDDEQPRHAAPLPGRDHTPAGPTEPPTQTPAPLSENATAPFGPIEHLLAELRRLDLVLLHSAPHLRRAAGDTIPPALQSDADDDPGRALSQHAASVRAAIRASQAAGIRLPLLELCRSLQLDDLALSVLILAIAPHVARHYEDVYAWLQNDAALRAPQLDLALRLFSASAADRLPLHHRLLSGPLFASGFVWLADGPRLAEPARQIHASPRLLRFLCDHPGAESEVEAVRARTPLPPTTTALAHAFARFATARTPVALVQTDDGLAALAAADQLARDCARPALLVDLSRPHAAPIDALLKAVFDEARLHAAVLAIAGYDDLTARDAAVAATATQLDRFAGPCFIIASTTVDLQHALHHRAVLAVTVPAPDAAERAALWRGQLAERPTPDDHIVDVARAFRLGATQIRDAARLVTTLDADGPATTHLQTAARAQSRHGLGDLAQRVSPWGRWQDLVAPQASIDRLRDLVDHIHHRDTVFVEWGLHRNVAAWRRVTALFAGPPGTGKTLSASLIAQALGLELFRIDLSGLVSKYIGETEKNLDRIFRVAHRSNAILFFDEADSLFGKRTEVKDAHDRYANIETSYLLQKLESFEGLAILATNFKKNIDPAFLRRIDVLVDFPMPAAAERRRLWRTLIPATMPLAPDVDLDFLAERFELSGGLIMNAIQAAATRSAAAAIPVAMPALLRGVRDELHKQGKLLSANDLGRYAHVLDGRNLSPSIDDTRSRS